MLVNSQKFDGTTERIPGVFQSTVSPYGSFLSDLHKGSIREESRGSLLVLARRHNQSPMNSKRNVLLPLINGLGDIHHHLCRECGLWTIC